MNSVLLLILGFALTAAAIVAVALIARKTMRSPALSTLFAPKTPRRIDIVEQATIDAKRKLLLVRRDNVEHLLMTGGPVDIVIESGIGAPRGAGEARTPSTLPLRPLGQAAGDR